MIKRNITNNILEALEDTPVIFLRGARQTGKTTLVKNINGNFSAHYITLDDATVLSGVKSDPAGFLAGIDRPVIIDEVQKAPELFPAIKIDVDNNRKPGMFILTGSSNILTSIKISDSLAGRMEILDLWPLSQGEINGFCESFIDAAFDSKQKGFKFSEPNRMDFCRMILKGGYPEAVQRISVKRRSAWFDSYITSILERDIRDIAQIQDLMAVTGLLKLLATRTANLLNYADISRNVSIPQTTIKRYMSLLKQIFLIYELPAWFSNLGKRLMKSPKLMFTDTAFVTNLTGFNHERLMENPQFTGALIENFVASEIYKQASWSKTSVSLFHYRNQAGNEVDIVLEDRSGKVVGIEIKSSSSVTAKDFTGLKHLNDSLNDKFIRGIILYFGKNSVPFGENLHAVPITAIWEN
ncbi:MAG: ATP-binding protein [Candidatus Magnetomorum sp.]|nr:ATP-binding protein [Candidatus Magnetomorum sp.]